MGKLKRLDAGKLKESDVVVLIGHGELTRRVTQEGIKNIVEYSLKATNNSNRDIKWMHVDIVHCHEYIETGTTHTDYILNGTSRTNSKYFEKHHTEMYKRKSPWEPSLFAGETKESDKYALAWNEGCGENFKRAYVYQFY